MLSFTFSVSGDFRVMCFVHVHDSLSTCLVIITVPCCSVFAAPAVERRGDSGYRGRRRRARAGLAAHPGRLPAQVHPGRARVQTHPDPDGHAREQHPLRVQAGVRGHVHVGLAARPGPAGGGQSGPARPAEQPGSQLQPGRGRLPRPARVPRQGEGRNLPVLSCLLVCTSIWKRLGCQIVLLINRFCL